MPNRRKHAPNSRSRVAANDVLPSQAGVFELDREFARQALGEKALTKAQLHECLGAQSGYADRGSKWALPVVACSLGYLDRRRVARLMRHMIRRLDGIHIGKYRCVAQLGRGGMGIVYLAHQHPSQALCAVKVLCRPDLGHAAVARFQHEGRTSTHIRHPNIVSALEVGEAQGWHYFAMEYVRGRTLSRVVAEAGPLPEVRAMRLTAQVAEGLAHAHSQGVIHRDVKPANILVTVDDTAKLCDLGLAKLTYMDDRHLSTKGRTVGSRRFISPEQARGADDVDARTDIYSLGLCLYYMATGKLPFADVPVERVMKEHLRGRLPWPAAVTESASPEISWLITRMSATDPASRYSDMADLARDLRTQIAQRG